MITVEKHGNITQVIGSADSKLSIVLSTNLAFMTD